MITVRKAAEGIVSILRAAYTPQTLARVDEKTFSHLNLDAYRLYREAMEREGYRFLSDLEIVELNRAPTNVLVPSMIRAMVSADGETCAAYYQVRHKLPGLILNLIMGILSLRFLWGPRGFLQSLQTKHCYDFETEIGGSYVTTCNATDAEVIGRPKSIDAKYFDYWTPLNEVRRAHESRLAGALRRTGTSVRPTKMSTYEDMCALQARLKLVKDAHRAASGWVTRDELLTLADGDAGLAEQIFEEVQKVLAENPIAPPKGVKSAPAA